ncbi:MAG: hypothetical protein JWO94_1570 [Verrucomicrobiaceae bacterium]|nr:hypothetical protein [Verrucomicrobiaceae bacterium]
MRKQSALGFTLLELVVVVAVLVILAGILLPKFDLFKLKANKGVAASNMTDVSRIIQTYFAQNAIYPDNWDSLMTPASGTGGGTPGALWNTANKSPDGGQLEPQLVGGPPTSASPNKLTLLAGGLTAGEARSLGRIGITNILDVEATADAAPNDRFTLTHQRPIATTTVLATLNTGVVTSGGGGADEDANNIQAHIYPNGVPANKRLVVLGFGSHNTSIGNLVQEVPFYPNTDVTKYYSRFLAIFEVDDGGGRANLMSVVGADGDQIGEEIADYYER